MQILRVDFDSRLSSENIKAAYDISKKEADRFRKLKQYYNANNVAICSKSRQDSSTPNNKAPIPYGRLIPKTIIGYLYSKDPEIVINNNLVQDDESFRKRTNELKLNIDKLIDRNGGYQVLKATLRNAVIYGIGYNAVLYINEQARIIALDPAECVQVHNHSLINSFKALVRFYKSDDKILATVFYEDAIVEYDAEFKETSNVQHPLASVPVAVCNSSEDNLGAAEPVLPLIDALDKVMNSDLDEIEKFAMAIRVIYGVEVTEEELKKIDEGKTVKLGDSNDNAKMEYLVREINDSFRGSVQSFLVSHIHKMSGVPDFADPNFAAVSGVALEYKLLGFETSCSDTAENAIVCLTDTLKKMLILDAKGKQDILNDVEIIISIPRNLPKDLVYKMSVATSMKNIGLSADTILKYLTDLIDNVDAEKKREEDEREVSLQSFIRDGNDDSNAA